MGMKATRGVVARAKKAHRKGWEWGEAMACLLVFLMMVLFLYDLMGSKIDGPTT